MNSGYGIISSHIASRLVQDGHQIEYIAWQYNPSYQDPGNYKIYPCHGPDRWGTEVFSKTVDSFKPEIVWCTGDIWMVYHIPFFKSADSYRTIWYAPIDSVGMSPFIKGPTKEQFMDIRKSTRKFNHIIGYTKFAMGEINRIVGSEKCTNYIYPGYDQENIYPLDRAEKRRLKAAVLGDDTPFMLLYVSRNGQRKNPFGVLEAFKLSGLEDAKLYFHCHMNEEVGYNLSELAKYLGISNRVMLSTIIPGQGLSRKAMNRLYNASDLHCLLSSREGFGMTYMEAAACGVPSIYTRANCAEEFGEEIGLGAPVVSQYAEAVTNSIMQIPSTQIAAQNIRTLHDDPLLWKKYSESAQAWAQEYTWDKVLDRWSQYIGSMDIEKNKVYESPRSKIRKVFRTYRKPDAFKVGIYSTWNEKCGIARYTKSLATLMEEKPIILAPDTSAGSAHGIEAVKCWVRGESDLYSLYKAIQDQEISVVHLQHEWSFTGRNDIAYQELMGRLREIGVKVVVTMHTMPSALQDHYAKKNMERSVSFLQNTDLIILHTEVFANLLHQNSEGLRTRVLIHGLEPYSEREKPSIPTFVSSGFAHRSKGFEVIIDASRICDLDHRLIIQLSAHPLDSSQTDYVRHIKKLASGSERISILEGYISDEEVSEMYARAWVGLFPYLPMSTHGVSGGACTCIGAGTPVVVSIGETFAAMREFPSIPDNADLWAREMKKIIVDRDYYQGLVAKAAIYKAAHSWKVRAADHSRIYRELYEA